MRPLIPLLLLTVTLAGCTGSEPPVEADALDSMVGDIDVSETTGGVRGIVVDPSIRPIVGATVTHVGSGRSVTTDDQGAFVVTDLRPGSYVLEASHPLYTSSQHTVEVVAGDERPPVVKFQLIRIIDADPYMTLEKFDGYIACSIGQSYFASEECGEGVGVPGLGRVGGQTNNRVQYDFDLDGPAIQTLQVEQVWDPNTGDAGGLFTLVATNWTCDPSCSGNELGATNGASPLLLRIDGQPLKNATRDGAFSTFTWADWGNGWIPDPDDPSGVALENLTKANVVLEQDFELFMTAWYHLPAPEGWSMLAGDPDPYHGF